MARTSRQSGIGQYRAENQSWLSTKTLYRAILSATGTDVSGPTGVSGVTAANYLQTDYAAEAVLNIYVNYNTLAAESARATLQVWVSTAADGPYYFVQKLVTTQKNQVFTLTNAPPGYYKIIVTAKTTDSLTIYTQFRI